MTPLLDIQHLSVEFTTYQGTARVLEDVSLAVQPGEILGLVGETGCGKSVLARSVLRLIPSPPGRISQGRVLFHEQDILALPPRQLRRIRGNAISMIFQEPMSTLNPVFTIGGQMREVVRLHQGLGRREAHQRCVDLLRRVQMPDPDEVMRKYPHELSGGMRQRVMIAMELTCDPELLIADEPTTALDVTVQGQVLAILKDLVRERGVAVLFITHDMGVVAQLCDRVAVMYAGKIVEVATVESLFQRPVHPYTRGLIASIPGVAPDEAELPSIPGTVPGLIDPPGGCRFHPRCDERHAPCDRVVPELLPLSPLHAAACHHVHPLKEEVEA